MNLQIHQQQEQQEEEGVIVMDESLSNLTCASGEASASISSINPSAGVSSALPPHHSKRKRSLPGNPDPDSEVIALSPKSLMATNRFMCEICNKGFQRDQNLQLHRRGHNLPWKLKQRSTKEVLRKKVYVCPEVNCVHHEPSRALGDLTGIKKHFCRKHGEKKWKCDKCSKRYAVQSDWKAHSKICGTREYRCDCGTLFSRRDSFITHRAFCDALAEETGRSISTNPILLPTQQQKPHHHHPQSSPSGDHNNIFNLPNSHFINRSHDLQSPFAIKQETHHGKTFNLVPPWLQPPSSSSSPLIFSQAFSQTPLGHSTLDNYKNPSDGGPMSATALLQKATQMGAAISAEAGFEQQQQQQQQQQQEMSSSILLDMMMNSFPSFDGENPFSGGGNEGLTRDFLGLRPLSQSDILSLAGLANASSSSASQQDDHHHNKTWQG